MRLDPVDLTARVDSQPLLRARRDACLAGRVTLQTAKVSEDEKRRMAIRRVLNQIADKEAQHQVMLRQRSPKVFGDRTYPLTSNSAAA